MAVDFQEPAHGDPTSPTASSIHVSSRIATTTSAMMMRCLLMFRTPLFIFPLLPCDAGWGDAGQVGGAGPEGEEACAISVRRLGHRTRFEGSLTVDRSMTGSAISNSGNESIPTKPRRSFGERVTPSSGKAPAGHWFDPSTAQAQSSSSAVEFGPPLTRAVRRRQSGSRH